ncbi:MAG TPA: glycosyltransferase [Thermoanaerobaculia bacterium]|nr:glycosyltransferase [Thermoanaerobaculia bacterium]
MLSEETPPQRHEQEGTLARVVRWCRKLTYRFTGILSADLVCVMPLGGLWPWESIALRIQRKPVIVDYYVSLYDTLVNDRRTVAPGSFIAWFLMMNDRRLILTATSLIFLNRSERDFYLKVAGVPQRSARIELLPLSTSAKMRARLPFARREHAVLTLCWWGTFIPLHGLEKILEAMSLLKRQAAPVRLFVFGTSAEASLPFEHLASEKDLLDLVSFDNTKRFVDGSLENFLARHCDVGFGTFGDSDKARTVLVNKVVEASAMGIPVVSQRTEAMREIFRETIDCFYVEATADSLADCIMNLVRTPHRILEVGERAHGIYERHFNDESFRQRFGDLVTEAAGG